MENNKTINRNAPNLARRPWDCLPALMMVGKTKTGGIYIMAYERKTRDRWDIMTNYGYGWDCECSEYTWAEAKQTIKEYRENACGRFSVKLEKHREKLEENV